MKIAKYHISKDNDSSDRRAGSVQYNINSAYSPNYTADIAKYLAETHLIWGQPFNGTQDVAGDIINAQNIINE